KIYLLVQLARCNISCYHEKKFTSHQETQWYPIQFRKNGKRYAEEPDHQPRKCKHSKKQTMPEAIVLADRKVSDLLGIIRFERCLWYRRHDGIIADTNSGIRFVGMLIYKEIVVAASNLCKIVEAFGVEEFGTPIGKVSPHAHVWTSQQRKRNILH